MVIFVAEWQSHKMDSRFPVGQARLETIGVLACALIMALASFQVVEESVKSLLEGYWNVGGVYLQKRWKAE
jgi:divalent metal cation (Fe/Co/Zn/Cd) transporter